MRKSKTDESKQLAKEFSTPARQLTSVQSGERIAEPLIYIHKTLFHKFRELKLHSAIKALINQAIESHETLDLETVFIQACHETGVTEEWAQEYFQSTRYKTWLEDRVKELNDQDDLTIPYLRNIELQSIRGEVKLTDGQHKSLERMEKRVWPELTRQEITLKKADSVTLDEMPDYQRKVDELQKKLEGQIGK